MCELPKRKNIRLNEYDYSQNGAYFITVCTKERQNIFWTDTQIDEHKPQLSKYGIIAEESINQISKCYSGIIVEKYVVMPNHVHMILALDNAPKIAVVIQQLKRYVSKQIGRAIWQKSYHDHIIRDENDYKTIWQYIDENPVRWKNDCYYE